jgi:tRNA dimethylallyltransferase
LSNSSTLIVILGPTASGKTAAAIQLAEKLGTEIISADSRQFYKEMSIGTAKPSLEQLSQVKHHFIGHLSVTDYYNVSRYENETLELLKVLFEKHKYVVMVGGSGLYIDAVCKGVDDLPDPDPVLRNKLKAEYNAKGLEYIQDLLKELDPDYFDVVDKKNPGRILRALEVCMTTGRPYSSLRKDSPKKREFDIVKYGIDIPRSQLRRRISARVESMVKSGLLKEVRNLEEYRELNALNTVGYKEVFNYFDGKSCIHDTIEKIKTNTRRYAKRQMTWFKRDKEIQWLKSWDDLPTFN